MRLCVRSLAMASAILWGGLFLLVAILNGLTDGYGAHLLNFAASIYPGYDGATGFGSIVVVTVYALVDGAIAGAVLAWLYNRFASVEA